MLVDIEALKNISPKGLLGRLFQRFGPGKISMFQLDGEGQS